MAKHEGEFKFRLLHARYHPPYMTATLYSGRETCGELTMRVPEMMELSTRIRAWVLPNHPPVEEPEPDERTEQLEGMIGSLEDEVACLRGDVFRLVAATGSRKR